jgi:excisionase family DNA binding protein
MENEVLLNEVLLTAREAAAELGVHVGTVHNAFQESRLPFVALYGRKLISRADLEAYKQRTRQGGGKPKGRPKKLPDNKEVNA